MRAEGDVTQISWPGLSVREVGQDKVGLALAAVLSLHLLGIERIFVWLRPGKQEKRLSM